MAGNGSQVLQKIASCIRKGEVSKIAFLTGAGISVAAGIPDFRSPGGMYDTLRPDLLTASDEQKGLMAADPTYVVDWHCFQDNQFPYLEVRRPFILGLAEGTWKPTVGHFFVRVAADKGLLHTLFTQNIDGLDFLTGLPEGKAIGVHGTMGAVVCEFCDESHGLDWFRGEVKRNIKDIYGTDPDAPSESTPVVCPSCGKAGVKPATVLYGRSLPQAFFDAVRKLDDVDLLVVAGTSLTVGPANQLVQRVPETCRRVLINNERVGAMLGMFRDDNRDVFREGTCDDGFCELAYHLGWLKELAEFRDRLADASLATLDEWLAKPSPTETSD